MQLPTNQVWVRFFHFLASLAGGLTALTGGVVLLIWVVGLEGWLITNLQEHTPMRPMAALGLLLGGAALLLYRHAGDRPAAFRTAQAAAWLVFALGLLTLAEHALHRELGLSRLLFPHAVQALGGPFPGRPSPQTGLSFALLGLGLATFGRETRRGVRPTEVFVATAALLPFLALLVYAYHLQSLYAPFGTLKSIALSLTSWGLVLLSLGVLSACPERGWMRHLASAGPGGVVLRRVLPAFIGVPLLVGVLDLMEQATLQPLAAYVEFGVLVLAVLVLAQIIRSGVVLDDVEASRRTAETELAERAEALKRSNERLTEIDRLKTDFVNAVSHELRTPLTSIRGYAEFLEDDLGGPLSPEQRGFVDEIQVSTRRLQRLVDDLLDFAKLEAGTFRLALSTSDLRERAREAVASLAPVAQRCGVRLTLDAGDGPLALTMDAGRIDQVLINLVGNALKFTPPGGEVRIRAERRDHVAWVGVEDTGIGIPDGALTHLFDKFYQVDNSSTRAKGGAGLGLAISKALVEAHGGHIGVDSRAGGGSTFWFTLPLDVERQLVRQSQG